METTEHSVAMPHPRHQPRNTNALSEGRLNVLDKTGVLITRMVGTMIAAILFTALSIVSLPAAIATHDKIIIVSWVAQTFLQLVLLPIIIVGQNIQGRHTEIMAEEQFQTTQTTYKDLEHLILVNKQQLDLLIKLYDKANKST